MKIIKISFFVFMLSFFNVGSASFAEEKLDCSQISTKTFSGQLDKWYCKRGKKREKGSLLKKLNPFKKKQ